VVFTAAVKFDRALKKAFCGDLLATAAINISRTQNHFFLLFEDFCE